MNKETFTTNKNQCLTVWSCIKVKDRKNKNESGKWARSQIHEYIEGSNYIWPESNIMEAQLKNQFQPAVEKDMAMERLSNLKQGPHKRKVLCQL